MRRTALRIALLTLTFVPSPARAQWPTTAAADLPVCTASGAQDQTSASIAVLNGERALVAAWRDQRNSATTGSDIYAQAISIEGGTPLWTTNGVAVCDTATNQTNPVLVADGQGGVIVFWIDARNTDVYAQRLDGNGAPLWGANGKRVFAFAGSVTSLHVDKAFRTHANEPVTESVILSIGVIATGGYDNLFLQRVEIDGSTPWGLAGLGVNTGAVLQYEDILNAASAESTIVVFFQGSGGVRGQRVTLDGVPRWGINGRLFIGTSGGFTGFVMAATPHEAHLDSPDAFQLFTTAGNSAIGGTTDDIWFSRVNADDGQLASGWPPRKIVDQPLYQREFRAFGACGDGPGYTLGTRGSFLVWSDYGTSSGWRVYAQRLIDSVSTFPHNGIRVSTFESTQERPVVVLDKDLRRYPLPVDVFVVLWRDSRGGLYAQRVGTDGTLGFDPGGFAVSTFAGATCAELTLQRTTSNTFGPTLLTTYVKTPSGNADVYAKRFSLYGGFAPASLDAGTDAAPPSLALAASPNPVRGSGVLRFTLPEAGEARLELLDLAGRRVATLASGRFGAGEHAAAIPGAAALAPGLYLAHLASGTHSASAKLLVVH